MHGKHERCGETREEQVRDLVAVPVACGTSPTQGAHRRQHLADAVLDGKASLPEVALGEDEFVELDAEGNVKKSTGRKKKSSRKPAKKATVKKKATEEAEPKAEEKAE